MSAGVLQCPASFDNLRCLLGFPSTLCLADSSFTFYSIFTSDRWTAVEHLSIWLLCLHGHSVVLSALRGPSAPMAQCLVLALGLYPQ